MSRSRASKYRNLDQLMEGTPPGVPERHQTFADAQEQARLALQLEAAPAASKRSSAETRWHVTLVILWWLVLFGLFGEFGTQPNNSSLPIIFLGWIVFGIWRVVRKYRRRRTA